MVTVAKMILTVLVSAILVVRYLSYHPHPLSNADATFLIVSALLSVWVAFLIWKIHCLREDAGPIKLVRKFTHNFLDPETIQTVVDKKLEKRAAFVGGAVERSIQFQKGGMGALGLAFSNDSDEQRNRHFETLRHNVDNDVKSAKDSFWELYDLAFDCGQEFSLKLRDRSYKNYLPKGEKPLAEYAYQYTINTGDPRDLSLGGGFATVMAENDLDAIEKAHKAHGRPPYFTIDWMHEIHHKVVLSGN